MEPSFDELPRGEWIVFGSMPAETTAENFAEWLHSLGFAITPDRIRVKNYGKRSSAIVSFPHTEVATMVNWVINNQRFFNLTAKAQPCRKADRATFQ
jgi:hypothetical protein